MKLQKHGDGTYLIVDSPAFGEIPKGSTWFFRPAYSSDGEAAIQFHDFSERTAFAMTEEEYSEKFGRYRNVQRVLDYSQGAIWPAANAVGLISQVKDLFDADEEAAADIIEWCVERRK